MPSKTAMGRGAEARQPLSPLKSGQFDSASIADLAGSLTFPIYLLHRNNFVSVAF
jgi:hypothetical protein